MSTELERHKAAVQAAITGLRSLGLDYAHFAHAIEERINEALHPQPEFEEVEVVRWELMFKDGGSNDRVTTSEVEARGWEQRGKDHIAVKLTGTLKRPKPQPVERTVSVPCRITGYPVDEFIGKPINLHSGERLYAFAEEDECHGKTGLLSFTWTEDPK